MPRVRIIAPVSGVDANYAAGAEVDLPGPTAASWIENGMAELVRDERQETPETDSAEVAPETTATRSRSSRARKSS